MRRRGRLATSSYSPPCLLLTAASPPPRRWLTIRLFRKIGLLSKVKLPTEAALKRLALDPQDETVPDLCALEGAAPAGDDENFCVA